MELDELQRLLTAGLDDMRAPVKFYWPAEGDVDIAERNIELYVGRRLIDAGFHAYAAVQVQGSTRQHLDLLALHATRKVAVLIETKRLLKPDKAHDLGRDWDRMRQVQLPQGTPAVPIGTRCFACLLASCRKSEYRDWWLSENRGEAPSGARVTSNWNRLHDNLTNSDVRFDVDITDRDPHWLLASITRMTDDHWWVRAAAPMERSN